MREVNDVIGDAKLEDLARINVVALSSLGRCAASIRWLAHLAFDLYEYFSVSDHGPSTLDSIRRLTLTFASPYLMAALWTRLNNGLGAREVDCNF